MKNKKLWMAMLVMVLAFGMTVVGCASYDSGGSSSSVPCPAANQCHVYTNAEGIGWRNTCAQSNCAAFRAPPYPLPPNTNIHCNCPIRY